MRISVRVTRALTIAALAGLMALAMLGFRAQDKDLQSLRQSSQEIIYWSTSQGEAELNRFIGALARFALDEAGITAEEVNRRFDILWSRVELFGQGEVGRRIRSYDADGAVIGELRAVLARHESAITAISRDDPPGTHEAIMADFAAAGERLRELSMWVMTGEEARLARAREDVRASARLTWLFSMAALALATLLIGIMLIETRRYRRLAAESAEHAARAEAASRAKSRFLTMMSHELRTPMNGVLGMLALVRQTALGERQLRLIEQAERSGRQTSALLGDILDYADLQSETLVVAHDMFELRHLARELEEYTGAVVKRAGVEFAVTVDPAEPRWAVGDPQRLRQAVGHFVSFLVEIVGAKDVRAVIGHAGAALRIDLDALVGVGDGPGWQPEAMLGRSRAEYGDFASDSLGPMIARGLVTLMGGTVTLARHAVDRATLSIVVPLELVEGTADCVRIAAGSVTMQAMLSALLRRAACTMWEPGAAGAGPTAVLMEAGGEDETARAARLRSDHPAARLVAVGTPRRPELFDAHCPQPLTADARNAAIAAGQPGPGARRGTS